jgi:hypothetical protein
MERASEVAVMMCALGCCGAAWRTNQWKPMAVVCGIRAVSATDGTLTCARPSPCTPPAAAAFLPQKHTSAALLYTQVNFLSHPPPLTPRRSFWCERALEGCAASLPTTTGSQAAFRASAHGQYMCSAAAVSGPCCRGISREPYAAWFVRRSE